jgi:FkbM family methyltransferase
MSTFRTRSKKLDKRAKKQYNRSVKKGKRSRKMQDLWQTLQKEKRPIVMYGMGNGADKILGVLDRYGISVCDFFASDGFVRGHSFHGKEVLTYARIEEKYRDFVVLLSFASARDEVLCNIRKIASAHPLYAPDVPVAGENLFDCAFYEAHKDEIETARSLLADEMSREVFDCVLDYKLSGKIDGLLSCYQTEEEIWQTVLHPKEYQTYADLGAYSGDTIASALLHADLTRIYAMEPDEKNFSRLQKNAQKKDWQDILCAYHAAAWDQNEILTFRQEGNRNAGLGQTLFKSGGTLKEVKAMPLDEMVSDAKVDYIKYDVEGAEAKALLGSQKTIARCRPDLCVSIYHRSEDLFALPLLVHQLCPSYRLTLRRLKGVPAWDLNLYASVK